MRHVILTITCLMALTGCATRENAKSVKYADTSSKAIVKILTADDVVAQLNNLDSSQRNKITDSISKVIKLASSISANLHPAIIELSKGDQIEDQSVDEAVIQTDQYVTKATLQAGRAEAESSSNNSYRQIVDFAVQQASGLGWAGLISGTGGIGVLIAGLLKGKQIYDATKQAVVDQVAYTKEVSGVTDAAKIEEIKDRHTKMQKKNGTHRYIADALTKAKT